jgi:hypothetical protein
MLKSIYLITYIHKICVSFKFEKFKTKKNFLTSVNHNVVKIFDFIFMRSYV